MESHPGRPWLRALWYYSWVGLLSFAPSAARAQTSRQDPVDLQARYGFVLNGDFPRRWTGAFQYELRMVNNASEVRGSYFTLEAGRRPWAGRSLELAGHYRLAMVKAGTYHRLGFGLEGGRKVGTLSLSLRTLLQRQWQLRDDDDEGAGAETFLRLRLRGKGPLGERWAASVAVEPYFTFSKGEYPIDNWRNVLTLHYTFSQGKRLDLFYMYRPDYARSYNRTFHTLGIQAEIDFRIPPRKRDGPSPPETD